MSEATTTGEKQALGGILSVNAEVTIAWPIILRTPLIGSRVSRSPRRTSYETWPPALGSYDVPAAAAAFSTSSIQRLRSSLNSVQ